MAKKPKQPVEVSPRGVFGWTYATKPDTKYAKPDRPLGDYKTQLTMSAAEAAPLVAKYQPLIDAKFDETVAMLKEKGGKFAADAKKLTKKPVVEPVYDDEGEETGRVILKFKVYAEGRSKETGETWSNKPVIVDAKRNPLNKDPFAGSEGKVSFQANVYYTALEGGTVGVSFRLKGLQVLKMVSGGARGDCGFEDEEDGYVAEDDSSAFADDSADDTSPGLDEDEF